jgi:hypothetical protein
LYLGIGQHARQITVSLRDEDGDVPQARQVSTQPEKVHAFFRQLTGERLPQDNSEIGHAVPPACATVYLNRPKRADEVSVDGLLAALGKQHLG